MQNVLIFSVLRSLNNLSHVHDTHFKLRQRRRESIWSPCWTKGSFFFARPQISSVWLPSQAWWSLAETGRTETRPWPVNAWAFPDRSPLPCHEHTPVRVRSWDWLRGNKSVAEKPMSCETKVDATMTAMQISISKWHTQNQTTKRLSNVVK